MRLKEAKSRTHQDDRSFTLHLILQNLGQQDPGLLRLVAAPREIGIERRRRRLEESQRERDARIDGGERRALDDFNAAHREEAVLDVLVQRAPGFEESCGQFFERASIVRSAHLSSLRRKQAVREVAYSQGLP